MSVGLNKNKNNDYREKQKETIVFTPDGVSKYIFDTLYPILNRDKSKEFTVLDVACGKGSLTKYWKQSDCNCIGIDREDFSNDYMGEFIHTDFFKKELNIKPDLILCNPPWNNPKHLRNLSKEELQINSLFESHFDFASEENHKLYGKKYDYNGFKYMPEIFMKRIFEQFGEKVPVVLLTIYGFLMNNGMQSKRYRWLRDSSFKITSILETPKDLFKAQGIDIWWHTIFFNIPDLPAIQFLPELVLQECKKGK